MGRSIKIRYTVLLQVEVNGKPIHLTASEWRMKSRLNGNLPGHGAPTAENLKKYVEVFEASTQPDGCNAHMGACTVVSAKVRDHHADAILATYQKV